MNVLKRFVCLASFREKERKRDRKQNRGLNSLDPKLKSTSKRYKSRNKLCSGYKCFESILQWKWAAADSLSAFMENHAAYCKVIRYFTIFWGWTGWMQLSLILGFCLVLRRINIRYNTVIWLKHIANSTTSSIHWPFKEMPPPIVVDVLLHIFKINNPSPENIFFCVQF